MRRDLPESYLEAWRPWWARDLRRLSQRDLEDELDYSIREIDARQQHEIITTGHMEPGDYLVGLLVRRQMLEEEVQRRAKLPSRLQRARPSLVPFAHELKAQLELHTYLVHIGFCPDMRRMGGAYYLARCPLHDDTHPSFYVWERPTPHWYCFGHMDGGDVYDFLMASNRAKGWREAVEQVAEYLNVDFVRIAAGS
jgi:hypothetical protein